MSSGGWTHDHPPLARDLSTLRLYIKVGVPQEERRLMRLYPQPRGRTQAVAYVPSSPSLPRPRRAIPARGQRS